MAKHQWIYAAASMMFLTSCGGDGGSAAGSSGTIGIIPSPSPIPTPSASPTATSAGATDKIIGAASTSQTFVDEGRYFSDGGIQVSFDAATGTYRTSDPANTTPGLLYRSSSYRPLDGEPWVIFTAQDGLNLNIRASEAFTTDYRYIYSNLAAWSLTPNIAGETAFGIPTPAGLGPSQSFVTYSGFLEGNASETFLYDGPDLIKGFLKGNVTLSFDPATGTAQYTITPVLGLSRDYVLSPVTGTLTWSSGAATFFQPVAGDPQSRNYPLSGRFTGPAAQELIGGFSFNYTSPVDGKPQTIKAAFIAKR